MHLPASQFPPPPSLPARARLASSVWKERGGGSGGTRARAARPPAAPPGASCPERPSEAALVRAHVRLPPSACLTLSCLPACLPTCQSALPARMTPLVLRTLLLAAAATLAPVGLGTAAASPGLRFSGDVLALFGGNRSLSTGQLGHMLQELGARHRLGDSLPGQLQLHYNQVRKTPPPL